MVTKQLFQAIDLSVPHDFLNRQCELMELPGLDDIIGDAAMLRCHPQDMKILRNALANVCQTLGDTPALINSSNMQYIINYEIPRLLLKTISVSETKKNIHNKSKKYHALNIAVEYIKANQSKNITLDSLCMESQVSARTLQHAFLEHFGQSPKTYLKVQRLNSVYKELRESEPVTTKITHVAYRHGFNHLSQFASDYKKLFGELPSVTLSKEK